MSDLTLRTAARTKVTFQQMTSALALVGQRAGERLRREQTGQDVIEYSGLIVLIAALIVALFALHIDTTVSNAVKAALSSIFGGGSSGGTTTTAAAGH